MRNRPRPGLVAFRRVTRLLRFCNRFLFYFQIFVSLALVSRAQFSYACFVRWLPVSATEITSVRFVSLRFECFARRLVFVSSEAQFRVKVLILEQASHERTQANEECTQQRRANRSCALFPARLSVLVSTRLALSVLAAMRLVFIPRVFQTGSRTSEARQFVRDLQSNRQSTQVPY